MSPKTPEYLFLKSRSLDSFGGPFGNAGIETQSFEDDSQDRNINTSTIIEPRVSQIDLDVVHVAIKNEDDSGPPPKFEADNALENRNLQDRDCKTEDVTDEPKSKRIKSENEDENNSCPSLEGSEEVKDEERNEVTEDVKNGENNENEPQKIDDSEWSAEDDEEDNWETAKENHDVNSEQVEELGAGSKTDEMILESRFTYIEESTVESDPSGNLDGLNEEKPCQEKSEEIKQPHGGGDGKEQFESEMTLVPDKRAVEKAEKDPFPPRAVDIRLGRSADINSLNDSFERSPSRNNDDETYEDEGGSEDNVEDNELSEAVSNRIKWRESNAGK